MKTKKILVRLISISALLASGIRGFSQEASLGQFDGHGDIGSPAISGSASYDPANQTYTLTGGGDNVWGTKDQFQFLWKKMKGDFILRARIELVGKDVGEKRKIGWIVRSSLESNAAFVDTAVENGVRLVSLQYRRFDGGQTGSIGLTVTNTDNIQLERRGTNYIFSAALSGGTSASANFSKITLPDDVFVGLFMCSHDPKEKAEVIFHDVKIISPAK